MNKNYELGGFIECKEDIDGNERDFEAFNCCLAESYVSAIFNEDFELLGEVRNSLLEEICYWFSFKNLENKGKIEKIKNGTFITINNRTFSEAIFDNKNTSLAETYILNEVYNPKLILTIILDETDNYVAFIQTSDLEKIENTINNLYDTIEEQYRISKNKAEFLQKVKNGINKVQFAVSFKQKPIPNNYSWVKALKYVSD